MSTMKGERKHENKPRSLRDSESRRFLEMENIREGLGCHLLLAGLAWPSRGGPVFWGLCKLWAV